MDIGGVNKIQIYWSELVLHPMCVRGQRLTVVPQTALTASLLDIWSDRGTMGERQCK